MGSGTTEPRVTFRERMHPPWWCWPAAFVWIAGLAGLLGISDGWPAAVRDGAVVTALLGGYASLIVIQVHEGAIVTARRAGGRRLPITDIVHVRVLTGRALREVRNRLTPSLRLHCPIWYRLGVQIITLDDDGDRIEHLYGLHDASGFLRAIGATGPHVDGHLEHHHHRGVPR